MGLKSHIAWSLSGNLIYSAAQWGILVAIAKFAGPIEVGQFTFGLAVAAPVFMLLNLQLRSLQATELKDSSDFNEYMGLRLCTTTAGLLAIAGYAIFRNDLTGWIVATVGLSKAFEAISDITYGLFQRHEQFQVIAKSLALKGIGSVVVVSGSLFIFENLFYALIGLTAVWFFILILFDMKNASLLNSIRPTLTRPKTILILKTALPLGVTMMLISLQTNVIRYFIEHYSSESALGIFGALSYVTVVGSMAINSIGQAASPRLADHWHSGKRLEFILLLKNLLLCALILGLMSVVLSLLIGESALKYIYSEKFAQHSEVFVVLMIGAMMFFLASVLGYALTSARITKAQPILFSIVVGMAIMSSWLLIPRWGIVGAAWATVLTSTMQFFGSGYLMISALRKFQ